MNLIPGFTPTSLCSVPAGLSDGGGSPGPVFVHTDQMAEAASDVPQSGPACPAGCL